MTEAITIHQPYASLIASGDKWVENRDWYVSHRGPIWIHAGLQPRYLTKEELKAYPTGCVLCLADLVECVELAKVHEGDLQERMKLLGVGVKPDDFLAHEHTEGPFCCILQDVRRLREPCPARGMQRIWNWKVPDLIEFE